MPSSPPETNALEDAAAEECCHDTAQTSPVSATVETAARAAKSQILIVLSAELLEIVNDTASDVVADTHTQIELVVRPEIYQNSGPTRSVRSERQPPQSWAGQMRLSAHHAG